MIFDSKTNSRGELRKRDYSTKGREAMRIALLDISKDRRLDKNSEKRPLKYSERKYESVSSNHYYVYRERWKIEQPGISFKEWLSTIVRPSNKKVNSNN